MSADRLIAEAGVSKVTFYRHFPSKDDLVLAYLKGRSALERHALEQFRARAGDTCKTLVAIARQIADSIARWGFVAVRSSMPRPSTPNLPIPFGESLPRTESGSRTS